MDSARILTGENEMRRLTDAFRRWRQRRREKIVKDATEKTDIGEPHMYQRHHQ
jgi:hypothetical protein